MSIGAYEAKTHFSQLLEQVANGDTVVITKHGHEVAKLVPADPASASPNEAIEAVRLARKGVRRGKVSVRAMIEEGRR